MVIYNCDPCGKPFNRKANYERHKNNKKGCKKRIPILNIQIIDDNNLIPKNS